MLQGEECSSIEDVKNRQDKLEYRQDKLDAKSNEHGERIVRVESKVDIALTQIGEIKTDTKQTQNLVNEVKTIAQSALSIVSTLQQPNQKDESSEPNSLISFIVDIFKDAIKVIIIAAFVSAVAYAVLSSRL